MLLHRSTRFIQFRLLSCRYIRYLEAACMSKVRIRRCLLKWRRTIQSFDWYWIRMLTGAWFTLLSRAKLDLLDAWLYGFLPSCHLFSGFEGQDTCFKLLISQAKRRSDWAHNWAACKFEDLQGCPVSITFIDAVATLCEELVHCSVKLIFDVVALSFLVCV